ncbi:hypothetical protein J41TS12_41440 [Paenibacillus antibioticophila]|uniref:Uncharacterized protein n=1 Tax=Paenibacillus antibioticophila TaxID=1274374 RepID=A0A920CJ11_9BACL|nr:hypothetical protein [Paenibacillus antibioticophila]GIO39283.1 hypothetical protein J41TS12_41440 [Paenibacillus antibioticophila]
MKMSEVIKEARRMGFKKVIADEKMTINQFEKKTSWFEGEYQMFNDPVGGRIERIDEPGQYFLKY